MSESLSKIGRKCERRLIPDHDPRIYTWAQTVQVLTRPLQSLLVKGEPPDMPRALAAVADVPVHHGRDLCIRG
jgi:hypothetical protein